MVDLDRVARDAARGFHDAVAQVPVHDIATIRTWRRRRGAITAAVFGFAGIVALIGGVVFATDRPESVSPVGPTATTVSPDLSLNDTVSGLSEVLLGATHLWPERSRAATPLEIVEAFAREVLGWDDPRARVLDRDGVDLSGPVWVRLSKGVGFAELLDVLTVPVRDGGRVIAEVSTPSAHGAHLGFASVLPPSSEGSGSSVGTIRVSDAAVAAQVTVRLVDGKHVVAAAGLRGPQSERIEIPQVADPGIITAVLIRYVDANGGVIAASGNRLPPPTVGPPAGEDAPSTTLDSATLEDPLFGHQFRVVLVFSDGLDGVTAVDPDERVAARSVIAGERAGDQPYRLTRIGDHLVVGWGEIYAHDIHTRQSTLLGEATIYVPAFLPDRVWLIDYPGGGTGAGTPTAWEVFANGNVATEPAPVEVEGFPAIGVRDGLALATDDGVAVWNAATGKVTLRFGTGSGFVSDVDDLGSRLAWCQDACTEMHITSLDTGEDLAVVHPEEPGRSFDARSARFSNDRRFLAAPAGGDVVIVDLEEKTAHVGFTLSPDQGEAVRVAWDPFGPFLYAAINSYGEPTTTLAFHNASGGVTDIAELPFGGLTGNFTVLRRPEAEAFLTDQLGSKDQCRPPSFYPSGRTDMCGFRF